MPGDRAPETDPEIALDRQIGDVARRMHVRRRAIATDAEQLRRTFNDRLRSPGALLTAMGVGVALEQSRRRGHWSLVSVLNVINAFLALKSSLKAHVSEPPSRGVERSAQ